MKPMEMVSRSLSDFFWSKGLSKKSRANEAVKTGTIVKR